MGYSAPEGEQFLTIPDAKLCNRPRKALQPYLQTFAGKGTKKTFVMKIPS